MAYDDNELGALAEHLSPIMSSGADWEKVLASGNPAQYLAAMKTGGPAGTAALQSGDVLPGPPPSRLAAPSLLPATNAPNPPAETTRTPAVPATVTPSGSTSAFARPAAAPDPNAIESQLVNASAPQSPTNPSGVPMVRDPNHPEYKPSAGRRIVRGLVAAGEGLAQGGLRGALEGALNPEAVGAAAYGSGTRPFSQAAQRNALLQDSLKQQLGQTATNAETSLKQAQAEGATLIPITQQMADANPAFQPFVGTSQSPAVLKTIAPAAVRAQAQQSVADINATAKTDVQTQKDEAQKGVRDAQIELDNARAEMARAGNDSNSPAYKLAERKLAAAIQGHAAAMERASAQMINATSGAYGTDPSGNALPGAIITDQGQPVGSKFQSNVRPTGQQRRTGNLAQSADQQLSDISSIVQKRQDIFGPLAGRTTEFTQWVGSQDPDAQRFRAARTIAGDHLAGVFGGRSEAALSALDTAIGHYKDNPAAIQAGIDQLKEANTAFIKAGSYRTVGDRNAVAPRAPAAGTVENGYRFKGGDPSKKDNWEAVKK